jgi:cysteine-rich repeat protein
MNDRMLIWQCNRIENLCRHGRRFSAGLLGFVVTGLLAVSLVEAQERCEDLGSLQSISYTDWESGLSGWVADSRLIANPSTFDTADWAVFGNLPDERGGMAAFVQNIDSGNCDTDDDETGVLMLDSPLIVLPGDIVTPRISINHWYWTELVWDGGNFKLSVNGGPFTLIPASAIERASYDGALLPSFNEFGEIYNTNPLAGEEAFTGASGSDVNGGWIQSWINLGGLAAAGDTIQLRLDFGVDCDKGEIGWYVDEVEVYACTGESPLPGCGDRRLDTGEECDDGNGLSGDGCSNICQVETGWSCSDPVSVDIDDPGLEGGTPSTAWAEISNNPIGTPICQVAVCGLGGGSGPSEGDFWAWFGGSIELHEASLTQSVVIPEGITELTFDLEIPACDSASDYLEVTVDGQSIFRVDGAAGACGVIGYLPQSADISTYADNLSHELAFHSETFSNNGSYTNFFVDEVMATPVGSQCVQEAATRLVLVKQVINDNGGTASTGDWTLTATGPDSFSGQGPRVTSPAGFAAGTYDLSESGPSAYVPGEWSCDGGTQVDADTITVADGESVTCTIRNDDLPPSLSLTSSVVNDDGGSADAADWLLEATGPTSFSGPGPEVSSDAQFQAGTYRLSISGEPVGYSNGGWSCDGGEQIDSETIRVAVGEAASCSIVLDDFPIDSSITAGHAGGWFEENTSGQGVLIDIEPENEYMFVAWYTFTVEGSDHPNEQRWLTAQGNYNGDRAELTLYETLGGRFDDPQGVQTVAVGTLTLVFRGCSELTMSYDITAEGLTGEIDLMRLIPGSELGCTTEPSSETPDPGINAGMDGGWFEFETSGQGVLIDVQPDSVSGGFIFVSWFTFGDTNASGQRWFTAQGSYEDSTADIVLYDTTGGTFNDPTIPSTDEAGTLSIEFTDCGHATLDYSVTDGPLSGEIQLIRLLPGGEKRCEQLEAPN